MMTTRDNDFINLRRRIMDYRKCAEKICKHIGGGKNVVSAAHCATRLRLVIADNSKMNMYALQDIEGVKGVFTNNGQLQLIIGTGTVNKVYDEFIDVAGVSASTKDEVKQAAAAKQPIWKRMIKSLGDVFVPLLPAIVASGLLMGLLEGLTKIWPSMASSGTYTIFHLFSNAAFVFLPILVAISAARVFGGNIFLGAVIGMIMVHPDLTNAWSVADMIEKGTSVPQASVWFGLFDINMTGYQGHVIPVIIAVWFMCKIEKWLHKHVPEVIDLFVTPITTVVITGYLTLTLFGPVFSTLENYILDGAQALITLPFGIGAALMAFIYPLTVVCGVHHMYNVIEAGMLSSAAALNTWMPIASAANFAQGAACLAVAIKTKNRKFKSLAIPSAMSAGLGITEPAIFGVNLPKFKPLIAGMIGGACGAIIAALSGIGATAYGVTGIFGFLITTDFIAWYAIELAVSFAVAFIISWVIYKEDDTTDTKKKEAKEETVEIEEQVSIECEANTVYCPMEGRVIPMQEIPDETFAQGIVGTGVGIVPSGNDVVAPFDGEVSSLFPTKHAICLTSSDGVEMLIHVGINTMELDGKYFEAFVKDGDKIKAGDKLLSFDSEAIKKEGYVMISAVLVANADDYSEIKIETKGNTKKLEKIMTM